MTVEDGLREAIARGDWVSWADALSRFGDQVALGNAERLFEAIAGRYQGPAPPSRTVEYEGRVRVKYWRSEAARIEIEGIWTHCVEQRRQFFAPVRVLLESSRWEALGRRGNFEAAPDQILDHFWRYLNVEGDHFDSWRRSEAVFGNVTWFDLRVRDVRARLARAEVALPGTFVAAPSSPAGPPAAAGAGTVHQEGGAGGSNLSVAAPAGPAVPFAEEPPDWRCTALKQLHAPDAWPRRRSARSETDRRILAAMAQIAMGFLPSDGTLKLRIPVVQLVAKAIARLDGEGTSVERDLNGTDIWKSVRSAWKTGMENLARSRGTD